ncbi:amino acid permease-associated region [Leptolyngbya sp. NIES-3755]|nr:amino acid permease-associated region [Leptolyngbya sp. NIES-3755]
MSSTNTLKRQIGLVGAIALGLGSIIGTGVFVSIGIATGVAGSSVIIAIALAAGVAICNGLNSAQLAASHPVSGGSYEYGYRYLNPQLGFTAGWMFLLAKSASAATAALGFAGYLLNVLGSENGALLVPIAFSAIVILTLVVLGGIRRSNVVNMVIVTITLLSLLFFVLAGFPIVLSTRFANFTPFFPDQPIQAILQATALIFVAYTGYGRIATMGEEVQDPQRTIPRAMIVTLGITMLLYLSVAVVGIGVIDAEVLGNVTNRQVAPLEIAARSFGIPGGNLVLAVGAMTATLGVLLNLILGLSRVLFAMGRRRDMPGIVARLSGSEASPNIAIVVMGSAIALLVFIGDVRVTWSFSAFSVLVYYAITNFAALRVPKRDRLYPKWIAWIGLFACLFLAFWVEQQVWIIGLGLIVVGLLWQALFRQSNQVT